MSSPFIFEHRTDLDTAVDLWISDQNLATATYGNINTWDVSLITNFSNLFYGNTSFNGEIGSWDVTRGKFEMD